MKKIRFSLGGLAFGLILSVTVTTNCLHAATFTVTTTNISGPGSLPVAISQANVTPGKNQIRIAVTNAIILGLQLPAITNSVSITGIASVPSIISGGGTLPLFTFAAGTTNILSNLVLANGNTIGNGAAINNLGALSVLSCVVTNNRATNGFGGAIVNNGVMAICSSVIRGNQAEFGGGIYNIGALVIAQSTFITNCATGGVGQSGAGGGGGGGGFGGALFIYSGTVGITNSTFFQNTSTGGRGGNVAGVNGGNGGGSTGGLGGLGYIYGSYASGTAGGAGGFGGGGGGGGEGDNPHGYFGGAGGSGGFGGGNGGSSAIRLGDAFFPGNGGSGFGGAIFIQAGALFSVNCTITVNSCVGGLGGLGSYTNGIQGQGCGGGVYNYGGNVTLLNTIVAGNVATNSSPDLSGNFLSSGYNLIGNNQGAAGLSVFDFQEMSADLGPLQNNGGSTPTCVPLPGSYAIGYGTSAGAPNTDQRGVPRPQGGAFDVGAVQVVTSSPIFIRPVVTSGSGFSLNTIFDATNSYRVQASTNLTNWTVLTNYGNGGTQTFIDLGTTNLSHRFYRTVTP
jgi:hypothetical protein